MSENGIPQLIKQLPKLLIYIVFFNHYSNNFYSQSVNIHAAILHSRESRSTVSEHLCLKKKKNLFKKNCNSHAVHTNVISSFSTINKDEKRD